MGFGVSVDERFSPISKSKSNNVSGKSDSKLCSSHPRKKDCQERKETVNSMIIINLWKKFNFYHHQTWSRRNTLIET